MRLVLSPKDNSNKLAFDVETYFQEGETVGVVMPDGSRRNYPFQHLWWYGTTAEAANPNRTRPL